MATLRTAIHLLPTYLLTCCRVWGANCEHVGSRISSGCPAPAGLSRGRGSCEVAECAEFYAGGAPNCSVFCRDDDSCSGHYTCDDDGRRVCLGGWSGPSCTVDVDTQSSECTCADGGTWLNGTCVGLPTSARTTADRYDRFNRSLPVA